MSNMTTLIKAIPVLIAAVLVGNWFLAEVRKAKAAHKPLYKAYLSIPGLLIIAILIIPVIMWALK